MIIDSHVHLDSQVYCDDLQSVIDRALKAKVERFIIPGADLKSLKKASQIAEQYEHVYFAVGVHPYDLETYDEKYMQEFLDHPKCVAIGECGLDYFRLPEDNLAKEQIKQEQKKYFIAQIKLAKAYKKPLIVHVREANADSYEILNSHAKDLKGVLHCFNASPLLLELKENFYFGIGGVLTFKNAKNLAQILAQIPLDRILIETDAPYLTPHPHRGSRNEPFYTTLVAQKISEILDLDLLEVQEITTQNAKRLFGIN